jgi:hypothetical protein
MILFTVPGTAMLTGTFKTGLFSFTAAHVRSYCTFAFQKGLVGFFFKRQLSVFCPKTDYIRSVQKILSIIHCFSQPHHVWPDQEVPRLSIRALYGFFEDLICQVPESTCNSCSGIFKKAIVPPGT